ncbi:MAG: response regulator, partial [Clostridia bacterium]
VTVMNNGRLGYKTFAKSAPGTFDAILMDIQMPVMNGYEATRAIRSCKHPQAKSVPIIAMTANAFAEDVQKSMCAGMNEHLAKPIEAELLYQTLHERLQT